MFGSPPDRREDHPILDEASNVEALGKYRVLARLGRGGMGDVFLAVVDGLAGVNKLAVVKRLRNDFDASLVQMFVDEARLAAQLNHPNVVHTYEAGASPAGYYIAMEYLEGQPLNAVLARAREAAYALPASLGVYVAREALWGLHYAHELCDYEGRPLGIVHRDISPHNIFLTYAGEVKVVDFGIAKAASNSTVTAAGSVKGKARYMAPEQARGQTDRRADLFAMGVVLWEFVTGERLFKGNDYQVLLSLMSEPIPPASSLRPGLDPALDAVIARALKRAPERRYQTAEQMRSDLAACLPGEPAAAVATARQVLNDLFAGAREESRRRVRAYLARPTAAGGADASAARGPAPPDLKPSLSDMNDTSPQRPSVTTSVTPAGVALAESKRPASQWARVGALAALTVVGGATLAAVATRTHRSVAPAQAPESPPGPAASGPPTAPTAQAAAAPASKLAITLETEPPGAKVTLDGKALGASPVRIEVGRAGHAFVVSKEGFHSEEVFVDGAREAGDAITRLVPLKPQAEAPVAGERRRPASAPPRRQPASAEATGGRATATTPAPPALSVRVLSDEDPLKSKVKVVKD
jgi:eukaryotic-like serine/threonine-protein kinase